MIETIALLSPVFLTIAVGWLAKQTKLAGEENWAALENIAYYVLFPAIVARSIAVADFEGVPVVRLALAMMLAILTMFALAIFLRRPLQAALNMDGPAYSSFFQGVTRWHTFLALAIMPLLFGPQGIALAALAAAAMIPLLNVGAVSVLSIYASGTGPSVRGVAKSLAVNPFVLSSLAGIALNVSGIGLAEPIDKSLQLIGQGALAAALLAAGAGLRLGKLSNAGGAVLAACILKLLIMPVFMWFWTWVFGVTGLPQAVAIVSGAVPSAAASYILARKMGGDAALIALILTAQVLLAALTLPFITLLAKQVAGVG